MKEIIGQLYRDLGVATDASQSSIREAFIRLSKQHHPDKNPGDPTAADRFTRINTAYQVLSDPEKRRAYDLHGKVSAPAPPIMVGKWIVDGPLAAGDIADLYRVQDPESTHAVLKIARSACDNDLLRAEATALKTLYEEKNQFQKYLPPLLAAFEASGRRVNVIGEAPAGSFTLADLLRFYPKGLLFRHVVWMMNRSLMALGYAHRCKVVHGALVPPHLLYGPETHSFHLVDWCYSSDGSKHIPAVVKDYRDWYPPELVRKEKPTASTDIYLLAQSLHRASDQVPKRFHNFFDYCFLGPRSRPSDAWSLQERWASLAAEEFGPPKYHKLQIPIS